MNTSKQKHNEGNLKVASRRCARWVRDIRTEMAMRVSRDQDIREVVFTSARRHREFGQQLQAQASRSHDVEQRRIRRRKKMRRKLWTLEE